MGGEAPSTGRARSHWFHSTMPPLSECVPISSENKFPAVFEVRDSFGRSSRVNSKSEILKIPAPVPKGPVWIPIQALASGRHAVSPTGRARSHWPRATLLPLSECVLISSENMFPAVFEVGVTLGRHASAAQSLTWSYLTGPSQFH